MSAGDPRSAQNSVREQLVAAALREPDPARTGQTALRDALVAAGMREHAGTSGARQRGRSRRRRRRATGVVVLALLGVAAGAQATGLISVGAPIEPHPGLKKGDPRVTANLAGITLVASAPDPERKTSWGVGIYTSAGGDECVIAGQVRAGNQLGLERDGVFHPYSDLRPGICMEGRTNVIDQTLVGGSPPRTLVYGRTTKPDEPPTFILRATGEERTAEPVEGGAYLLVYDGALTPGDLTRK